MNIKPLTDFRWATVRAYVASDLGRQRDAGTSAVFAFAALCRAESVADECKLHSSMESLHSAAIEAGCLMTNEQAMEVNAHINDTLGLAEAAQVETPEGKQ